MPNAIDVNRTVRQGHADYDFEYKDLTIDIKTSLRRHNGKWSFKLGGGAELFVLMLLSQDGDLEKIFLLPRVLAYSQSLELSVNTLENRLGGYLVAPEELNDALDAIVQDGGGVND